MKKLIACRHAKSSWGDSDCSDHDRPLNERGLRDAPVMGDALRSRGIAPDLILSSTALRALTTAQLVAEKIDFPASDILQNRDCYLASAPAWLERVRHLDEDAQTAMIFGHNPGMHEFVLNLAHDGAPDLNEFPTLGTAIFELDIDHWALAEWGGGRLIEFLAPKEL